MGIITSSRKIPLMRVALAAPKILIHLALTKNSCSFMFLVSAGMKKACLSGLLLEILIEQRIAFFLKK
jgi:hypothetical protein